MGRIPGSGNERISRTRENRLRWRAQSGRRVSSCDDAPSGSRLGLGIAGDRLETLLVILVLASCCLLVVWLLAALWVGGSMTAHVVGTAAVGVVATLLAAMLFMLRRRRHEASFDESAFQKLVDSLPDGVFVLEVPERRIVYANRAVERIFGYRVEELLGQRTDILHQGAREFEAFHTGSREELSTTGTYLGEFEMRRRDGSVFPTSHVVCLLDNGEQGGHVVSVVRDETPRVTQERKLAESKGQIEALAGNLHEVFWIANPDRSNLQYVSSAYETVWKRPIAALYENPFDFLEAVHPEDRAWVTHCVLDDGDIGHDIEYRIRWPNGDVRWIWDRAIVLRDSAGEARNLLGVAEDITTLREHHRQTLETQKLEVIGQLAGGLTHDFNNLLMVIMGNAEDLTGRRELRTARSELQAITAAAERALDLSRRLLSFTRYDETRRERIDINALVGETCHLLEKGIGKEIELEVALDDGLWPVFGDPFALQMAIVNLAINARDAMPGGGRLSVRARNVRQGANGSNRAQREEFVVVQIEDTGTGIPDEIRDRIFEPYFTTKPAERGTGLGLSIVRETVEAAGGEVRLQSRPGRGSEFEVWLPRCQPPADSSRTAGKHETATTPADSPPSGVSAAR